MREWQAQNVSGRAPSSAVGVIRYFAELDRHNFDHSTIARWVLFHAPILNRRIRREKRRRNRCWRLDETYLHVAGKWTYLYRPIDSADDTIDLMLSPNRDLTAARYPAK